MERKEKKALLQENAIAVAAGFVADVAAVVVVVVAARPVAPFELARSGLAAPAGPVVLVTVWWGHAPVLGLHAMEV
jgi:hypothetical protein